jgi:prenylcysteine oxidase/farnesylcysteine lyase
MRYFGFFLLLCGATHGFQLPFNIPFLKTKGPVADTPPEGPPRIAIIGAGAGGSSAAFWLSKAKERFGIDVEVDVYDRESYIGGSESKTPSILLFR